LAKDVSQPVGFVFYTKNETVEQLRSKISKKMVLPHGSIFNFFNSEDKQVTQKEEYETKIKELAVQKPKENQKIFVKTKANKVFLIYLMSFFN
jgi:hypothetical protein